MQNDETAVFPESDATTDMFLAPARIFSGMLNPDSGENSRDKVRRQAVASAPRLRRNSGLATSTFTAAGYASIGPVDSHLNPVTPISGSDLGVVPFAGEADRHVVAGETVKDPAPCG